MASLKDYLRTEQGAFLSSNKKWVATQSAPHVSIGVAFQITTLQGVNHYVAPETGWVHVEVTSAIPGDSVNIVSNSGGSGWISNVGYGARETSVITSSAFVKKGAKCDIYVFAKSVNVAHFIPSVGSQ